MQSDAMTPEDLAQIAAIVDAAEQRITRNTQEVLDRAAQAGYQSVAGSQQKLDQPALRIHARIWRGAGASQQTHAGRAAGAADRECAAGDQDTQFEADASGDLLRRIGAGAGFCA